MPVCMIEDCTTEVRERSFCDKHWKMIPQKAKRVFWQQTDYGKAPPSPDLIRLINDSIPKVSLCPRCGIRAQDPALLGRADEGHICGECWKDDRHSEGS